MNSSELLNTLRERSTKSPIWQKIAAIFLIVLAFSSIARLGSNPNNQSSQSSQQAQNITPTPDALAPLQLMEYKLNELPLNQISIQYNTDLSDQEARKYFLEKYKLQLISSIPKINVLVLSTKPGNVNNAIAILIKDPMTIYAEPDFIVEEFYAPNDPSFSVQYAFSNSGQTIAGSVGLVGADIDMTDAWDITKGNNTPIAVLDSGIDLTHPDLSSKVILSRNFSTASSVQDVKGHGTHTAGIIAAITNNSTGIAGGCPDCKLIIGKTLGDDGKGAISWVVEGIIWAADNGARVISMSFGAPQPSNTLDDAIAYAAGKGAVLVAAAGNNSNNQIMYPAGVEGVIAVAATDNKDLKASYSSYGASWVDVAAPGSVIYSTIPGGYGAKSGTSMAAPMVSATAGLVWASSYGTSASAVRNRIEGTTDPTTGSNGTYWKYGRINAASAVGASGGSTPVSPSPSVTISPTIPSTSPTISTSPGPGQTGPTGTTNKPSPTISTSRTSPTKAAATPTSTPTQQQNPTFEIKGKVYNDKNKNGVKDTDEVGVSGIEIKLFTVSSTITSGKASGNNYVSTGTTTNNTGNYSFKGLSSSKKYDVQIMVGVWSTQNWSISQPANNVSAYYQVTPPGAFNFGLYK